MVTVRAPHVLWEGLLSSACLVHTLKQPPVVKATVLLNLGKSSARCLGTLSTDLVEK